LPKNDFTRIVKDFVDTVEVLKVLNGRTSVLTLVKPMLPVSINTHCIVVAINSTYIMVKGGALKMVPVIRWPDCFSIFGHLHRWNYAHKHTKVPNKGSELCQTSNKPLKCCQRFLKYRQTCSHCQTSTFFLDITKCS